jgi:hypothetical protein
MSVRVTYRPFDAQAEMNTAPNLWIADKIVVPASTWFHVPTAKRPNKSLGLEATMDELEQWHAFQVYNSDGEFVRGPDTRLTDEVVKDENLQVVTGGIQGFLCFFPADGVNVWLRSRGRYQTSEYNGTVEMELDSEGGLIQLPPDDAPTTADPFRFVGSAERTMPYVVGPFTRNGSVWIYASAEINVCWTVFPGRSTGLSIQVG